MITTRFGLSAGLITAMFFATGRVKAADLQDIRQGIVSVRWNVTPSGDTANWSAGPGVFINANGSVGPGTKIVDELALETGVILTPEGSVAPPTSSTYINLQDGTTARVLLGGPLNTFSKKTHRVTGFRVGDHIVTVLPKSAHKSRELVVTDSAGREYKPKVQSWDGSNDLTVLDIDDGGPDSALTLSDEEATWGQEVRLAYEWRTGNPALLRGIVSTTPEFDGTFRAKVFDVDATAPLNSVGAPILNEENEVVGVVKGPRSDIGKAGPPIAIDVEAVRKILSSKGDGRVAKPIIGAALKHSDEGVVVMKVLEGTPAQKAGLAEADIIQTIDAQSVGRLEEVINIVNEHQPGDVVELEVVRDGEARTFSIEVVDGGEMLEEPKATVVLDNRQPVGLPSPAHPGLSEDALAEIRKHLPGFVEVPPSIPGVAPAHVRVMAVPPDVNQQLEALRKDIGEIKEMLKELKPE